MNTWISVVVVIVLVAGFALWRERSRMAGLEQWMTNRGFTRRFPVPPDGPEPATRLVAHMSTYRARIWGLVLEGDIDRVPVIVGEHESSIPGRRQGFWHTMVMWRDAGAHGTIVLHRAVGPKVITDTVSALSEPVLDAARDVAGLEARDLSQQTRTPGGWTVVAEPLLRDGWLSAGKVRQLDDAPHGGSLVRDDGWCAWRVRGNVTVERMEALRAEFAAVRRLLQ
jgi:hypothetical protein